MTIPSASPTFYSDEFGPYMSGYAPIKDSNGTTVVVLGVDVTAVATLQQIDNVRNSTAIIIMISVIIGTIIILLFSLTFIRDIKKLNVATRKISTGSMSASMDIKRKDEVGELSDSFGRMIASLKIETMMRNEDEMAKMEAKAAKGQEKGGARLSAYSDEVVKVTQRYLDPSAKTFLERQTRSHMNCLDLNNLERANIGDLV